MAGIAHTPLNLSRGCWGLALRCRTLLILIAFGGGAAGTGGWFFGHEAQAFSPLLSDNGAWVRWENGGINLVGNPSNRTGFDPGTFFRIVTNSLQQWQFGSAGVVEFAYWQGTDPSEYEANSDFNGHSSIYMVSGGAGAPPGMTSSIIGLTQVYYETDTGKILETDVALNDRDFAFTDQPEDTTGYGNNTATRWIGGRRAVYLQNVVTHELGHAFGLTHSGQLQASMLFMEAPEEAKIGCDDQTAIKAMYPAPQQGARGGLQGRITTVSGGAAPGAHVVAIALSTASVEASSVADPNGVFHIPRLKPGSYAVLVEPFSGGAHSLAASYAYVNPRLCAGAYFSRRFVGGGTPTVFSVAPGVYTDIGSQSVSCEGAGSGGADRSSAAVEPMSGSGNLATAPNLINSGGVWIGADQVPPGGHTYYRVSAVTAGRLRVRVMSYGLYAASDSRIRLRNTQGAELVGQSLDNVYQGASGFKNYDSALDVDLAASGDYIIDVENAPLSAQRFPAGSIAVDNESFLLVFAELAPGGGGEGRLGAADARCSIPDSFPAYRSPDGPPPRSDTGGGGFCLNINDVRKNRGERTSIRPRAGPGGAAGGAGSALATWLALASFMIPIAACAGAVWVAKRVGTRGQNSAAAGATVL